jgi:sugar/nucleoside kinase (ribokinase family)
VLPDLVVVGAAARDMTPVDSRGWRLGGSATYAALAAGELGVRVGCVLGVDAAARTAHELQRLREAGVDVLVCPIEAGPVFRNTESGGVRTQAWASVSDQMPVSVPNAWRLARYWLFVPVASELQDEWATIPPADAFVGVGWQGLLRAFRDDKTVQPTPPVPSRILARANATVASIEDFSPLTTELRDLVRCIDPESLLILTMGARGGIVRASHGLHQFPAIPSANSLDPTGAGDVFLSAFISSRILMGKSWTLGRALRMSAAAGSCAVESTGLDGVPTRGQLARRLGESRVVASTESM